MAALTGPQESVEERRALYEARRDRVVAAIPGARSEGTFFAWLRLPEGVTAERILEEARVALAPGEGFGSRGAGHARISLAVSDEALDEGLERLARAPLAEPRPVELGAQWVPVAPVRAASSASSASSRTRSGSGSAAIMLHDAACARIPSRSSSTGFGKLCSVNGSNGPGKGVAPEAGADGLLRRLLDRARAVRVPERLRSGGSKSPSTG